MERGRDKHNYTSLADVLIKNGLTRIDDISQLLPDQLRSLAENDGVEVTLGLVLRVLRYAKADTEKVNRKGK